MTGFSFFYWMQTAIANKITFSNSLMIVDYYSTFGAKNDPLTLNFCVVTWLLALAAIFLIYFSDSKKTVVQDRYGCENQNLTTFDEETLVYSVPGQEQ